MVKFKLKTNHSVCVETDSSTLAQIINAFSYPNPLVHICKSPWVNPFIYSISPLGLFKIGLFPEVLAFVKTIETDIVVDEKIYLCLQPSNLYLEKGESTKIIDSLAIDGCEIEYRDYQRKAIRAALENGRGIILSPTASGKSLIIAGILYNLLQLLGQTIDRFFLLIVPSRQLVDQMYNDFISYGINIVQKFTSGNKENNALDPNFPIVISNRQWLERKKNAVLINKKIDVFFCDECQQINAENKVSSFAYKLPTKFKFGCTATLPTNQWDKNEAKGVLGPILFDESIINLQEQGFIAKLNLISVQFVFTAFHKEKLNIYKKISDEGFTPGYNYISEKNFFYKNEAILTNMMRIISQLPGNTIVFFEFVETGKMLYSIIEKTIYKDRFRYIDGSIPMDKRNEIKDEFLTSDNLCILAQCQTFDTGINIKNIHNVVFIFSTKSPVKIFQSIGRGLRMGEYKNGLNVFDFNSNLRYAKKHLELRKTNYLEYYKKSFDHEIKLNYHKNVNKSMCNDINARLILPKSNGVLNEE